MAEISTQELFRGFIEENDGNYLANSVKSNLDKPEFYKYEQEIGKEFLDMNEDEIKGLLSRLGKIYSFGPLMSVMRELFDFYIDRAKVKIKNPFNSRTMDNRNVALELIKANNPLRFSDLEEVLNHIRSTDTPTADYVELILRLWYDGFFMADEIVDLKKEDINPRNLFVTLPGRTIRISSRTYELLCKFEKMDKLEGRRERELVSWHGSFFKFTTTKSRVSNVQSRPKREMAAKIYYSIKYVNMNYGTNFNYRNVYWLGFFDFLCRKYGEKKVTEIVLAFRDEESIKILENNARDYGLIRNDAVTIRKYLRDLVRT